MRNLNAYAQECMKELDAIGIEYGNITSFNVNTRAKKRWGRCTKIGYNDYTIEINATLLDERNDVNGLKNTIIHELLHSCEGCMNHGSNWKRLADKVRTAYGYNIKRCSSAEEKGIDSEVIAVEAQKQAKYAIRCECCGKVYERARLSKAIQHPDWYRCSSCGGKLTRIR